MDLLISTLLNIYETKFYNYYVQFKNFLNKLTIVYFISYQYKSLKFYKTKEKPISQKAMMYYF